MGGVLAVAPDVLVLRALGLGDLLTAVPALRALRRVTPGRLVLAGPAALGPLALLTGAVDEVVDTVALAPLTRALRGARLAVNLHGRGPQSTALLQATGPARLLAYELPGAPIWDDDEHERSRWCRLVASLGRAIAGHPSPDADRLDADRLDPADVDPDNLDLDPPEVAPLAHGAVLVHPGAAYASRRWPAARWSAVARALVARGEHVLITGSGAERDLACAVAAGAGLGEPAVLAGRTGLLELASLVAASRLLLSADTGIAHLATALGTPSVVLFGPASPARWRAPPTRPQHRVLWAGRTGDVFADTPDPGLLEIDSEAVLAQADLATAVRQARR